MLTDSIEPIIVTALSPHWDSDMNFNISVPELCLIRFCVRDQTGLLSSDFVGQYMLPFSSLKKGEPQTQREQQGVRLGPDWESDWEISYTGDIVWPLLYFPSFTSSALLKVGLCSALVSFYGNATIYYMKLMYLSSNTYIFFHTPFLLHLQATAGCHSGLEMDAAWIQPPSLSLCGIPKNSSPYQTQAHHANRQKSVADAATT